MSAIKRLQESESYLLFTVKWVDGTAEVTLTKGGAKHGWEYCLDYAEELKQLDHE